MQVILQRDTFPNNDMYICEATRSFFLCKFKKLLTKTKANIVTKKTNWGFRIPSSDILDLAEYSLNGFLPLSCLS